MSPKRSCCGGMPDLAIMSGGGTAWRVECQFCGEHGPCAASRDEATRLWNLGGGRSASPRRALNPCTACGGVPLMEWAATRAADRLAEYVGRCPDCGRRATRITYSQQGDGDTGKQALEARSTAADAWNAQNPPQPEFDAWMIG